MARQRDWFLSRYQHFIVAATACFIAGTVAGYLLQGWGNPDFPFFRPWTVASVGVLAVGLILWSTDRRVIRGSLWLTAFLLGGLYLNLHHFTPAADDIGQLGYRQGAVVEGVLSEREIGRRQRVVSVKTVDGKPVKGNLVTVLPRQRASAPVPEIGATLQLMGDLRPPYQTQVPGAFREDRYLWNQHITARLVGVRQASILNPAPATWQDAVFRFVARIRDRIAGVFTRTLPSPDAEILGGIVLGDRAIPVDKNVRQQFIHTGLIHLLAASGLNVGIVAAIVMGICQRFLPYRRLRLVLAMAAVAVYALLTGLPPSIQRAGVMLELALFLKLVDRDLSALSLLSYAALALILYDPEIIGNVGFQFSVLTTLGLITMVPPLQKWLGYYITEWLSGVILVPLVAQLWVIPLSLYYFNQMPVHSVPLNMAALMLVTPLTAIGFTAGALSLIWEPLGQWVSYLAWPFLKGLVWLVAWGDSLTWAQWSFPSPEPWLVVALYGVLVAGLLCLYPLQKLAGVKKISLLLGAMALVTVPLAWQRWAVPRESQVELIPLSYRHVALVVKPEKTDQSLLVLPAGLTFWESRALNEFARHRLQRKLSAVVLLPSLQPEGAQENNAPDSYLKALVRQSGFPPVYVVTSGPHEVEDTGNLPVQSTPMFPAQLLRFENLRMWHTFGAHAGGFILGEGHYCILLSGEETEFDSPNCLLKISLSDHSAYEVLLKGQPERILPDRYYRLRLSGHRARLY